MPDTATEMLPAFIQRLQTKNVKGLRRPVRQTGAAILRRGW